MSEPWGATPGQLDVQQWLCLVVVFSEGIFDFIEEAEA